MARIYLAGPITGRPNHNAEAFAAAAADWRAEGWEAVNPLQLYDGVERSWIWFLRRSITLMLTCDAVALLTGWQESRGAVLEVSIARELALALYDADTFAPYRESVLAEAERHIHGARPSAYGHPLDNHQCTADLWRTWLRARHAVDVAFTPEDVCHLNILQKESRAAHRDTRDNLADVCGYAGNIERIWIERARRVVRLGA